MREQFQEEKMHTKDAIKFALTVSNGAVLSVIDEMSAAATTFPTPNGGCHPLWVLGHLTLVEGSIPAILLGEKNPAADWQQYFGENSEPVADASAYPPFAEVRKKYLHLREQNLKLLESLSEADLDKPTKAPPNGREQEFSTYGQSFLVLALHQSMHRSHVTDAKRAAGRGAQAKSAA
jgi:DinB superfamily